MFFVTFALCLSNNNFSLTIEQLDRSLSVHTEYVVIVLIFALYRKVYKNPK